MPLPTKDTPEWDKLVAVYPTSTKEQREEWAKLFGYSHVNSFTSKMAQRNIHLATPNISISTTAKEEPQVKVIPIPKIQIRKPPKQGMLGNPEVQGLIFSDQQFGLKTKSYNKKVAIQRCERVYDTTCRFADIKRKFCPVKKLVLWLLGDLPHGELIGRQVMLDELELTLDEQKWLAYEQISQMLINLCQWYEEIEVICVAGNHGIMGKYFSGASNWNIVIYDMLLVGLKGYPQIKITVVRDDFYNITKVYNTKFLSIHGDKIPMYLNLPFYGIDRRSLRWNQSLPSWDILLMGHFHTATYMQPSGIPIFINGTLCSDSKFVAQWLGIREIAQQWTFFVGEKHGITGMHLMDLMKEAPPTIDELKAEVHEQH